MFEKLIGYFLSLVEIKNLFNTKNIPYVEMDIKDYTYFDLTKVELYDDEYLCKQLFFLMFINDPDFIYNYDEYLMTILNEIEYRKSLLD